MLAGVRGEPPVDLQVVARAAVALGRYAAEHAERIASIDLNPLIAGAAGQGAWAVDAVIEQKQAMAEEAVTLENSMAASPSCA